MNLNSVSGGFTVSWFLVGNLERPKVFWSVSSFDFQLIVITMLGKKNAAGKLEWDCAVDGRNLAPLGR